MSYLLNAFLSQSLAVILLVYGLISLSIILLFSVCFYIFPGTLGVAPGSDISPTRFVNHIYFSATSYYPVLSGEMSAGHPINRVLVLVESVTSFLTNGSLIAIIVYKLMRLTGQHFIISEKVVFTPVGDGARRLEVRIYNSSVHEIVDLRFRMYLRRYLDTYPQTNYSTMYDIVLNRSDYPHLTSRNYIVITSANGSTSDSRSLYVPSDLFECFQRFDLYLTIEGQYLSSGLRYSQFKIFPKKNIIQGRFQYITLEDLVKGRRLVSRNFHKIVNDQSSEEVPQI